MDKVAKRLHSKLREERRSAAAALLKARTAAAREHGELIVLRERVRKDDQDKAVLEEGLSALHQELVSLGTRRRGGARMQRAKRAAMRWAPENGGAKVDTARQRATPKEKKE